MTTAYPGGIDLFTDPTSGNNLNDAGVLHADQHANVNDAVHAIETELGTNPKGTYASVAARLAAAGGGTTLQPGSMWTFPGVVLNGNDNAAYPAGGTSLGQFEGQLMQLDEAKTLAALAVHILTASGSAGSTATLSIYSVAAPLTSSTPTATLVLNAGTVATDSTGFKSITGLSTALAPGNYMVGFDSAVGFTPYRLTGPRVRWINDSNDFTSANQVGYVWHGTVSGHPSSLSLDGAFRRPSALCAVMVKFA